MARTFTQEEVDAIVDRAVQAVRAQLQAVLTDNETLREATAEAAARLDIEKKRADSEKKRADNQVWRRAIKLAWAETLAYHRSLLTRHCSPP